MRGYAAPFHQIYEMGRHTPHPASGLYYRVKSYEMDLLDGCSRGEAGTVGYTI